MTVLDIRLKTLWLFEKRTCMGPRSGVLLRATVLAAGLIAGLFFSSPSRAACSGGSPTWTAASASQSDVQACVSAASNRDTILVPAGTASYGSPVDIPAGKCVTINGQSAVTITSTLGFTLEAGSCESRITGFAFTGASSNTPNTNIVVTTTESSSAGRVDHNTFTNSAVSIFIQIQGLGPFLFDHNTFSGGPASEEIHILGANPGDETGWTTSVTPGGPNMVFVEDNTFINNGSSSQAICSGVESYYGARTVIRHNTTQFCQVDQHGTAGYVGARWWEIYDNVFNTPSGWEQCCYMDLRGGSGVVWGNSLSGSNAVTGTIDLRYEESGTWPQAWQPGSGFNGDTTPHNSCGSVNSAPAYLWGNDAAMQIYSESPSLVVQNRDYFVSSAQPASMNWEESSSDTCSTTHNYTPYTYPHPLQSGGGQTNVAPPSNLTATVQ